jgi:hypothetical protein
MRQRRRDRFGERHRARVVDCRREPLRDRHVRVAFVRLRDILG